VAKGWGERARDRGRERELEITLTTLENKISKKRSDK
jgi:hypothetical protein